MLKVIWWLIGERHILTTNMPPYRERGRVVEIAGECFRITRVIGQDVWGRPVRHDAGRRNVTVVESPLKHLRQSNIRG